MPGHITTSQNTELMWIIQCQWFWDNVLYPNFSVKYSVDGNEKTYHFHRAYPHHYLQDNQLPEEDSFLPEGAEDPLEDTIEEDTYTAKDYALDEDSAYETHPASRETFDPSQAKGKEHHLAYQYGEDLMRNIKAITQYILSEAPNKATVEIEVIGDIPMRQHVLFLNTVASGKYHQNSWMATDKDLPKLRETISMKHIEIKLKILDSPDKNTLNARRHKDYSLLMKIDKKPTPPTTSGPNPTPTA